MSSGRSFGAFFAPWRKGGPLSRRCASSIAASGPKSILRALFSSDAEAQNAISTFNEFELDGRKLRVNAAEDRPPRRGPAPGGFSAPRPFTNDFGGSGGQDRESFGGGFGGGFGKPFHKPKGSRRGLRARKRSLG